MQADTLYSPRIRRTYIYIYIYQQQDKQLGTFQKPPNRALQYTKMRDLSKAWKTALWKMDHHHAILIQCAIKGCICAIKECHDKWSVSKRQASRYVPCLGSATHQFKDPQLLKAIGFLKKISLLSFHPNKSNPPPDGQHLHKTARNYN